MKLLLVQLFTLVVVIAAESEITLFMLANKITKLEVEVKALQMDLNRR